ncbi:MAG: VIT1/CCC1 transporter family protein [Corynebacterium sp.]|nr:VIT1/CCC1 transporter family protein [Corynebacterium sp.]
MIDSDSTHLEHPEPTAKQIRKWQKYLAGERAEAALYRDLASRKTGEDREILLSLAKAESRHEAYWVNKLGDHVGMPRRPDFSTRVLGFLAKYFGSVVTLALMQSAESKTPYERDPDVAPELAADERIHAEVVRGLAARGREKLSGNFRAAIFGANDGLVSNLALILGVVGTGTSHHMILLTGISGLLAGALSMAAGEFVSVSSQKELLQASTPDPKAAAVIPELDVNANELELVYRARGMSEEDAHAHAQAVLHRHPSNSGSIVRHASKHDPELVGSGIGAAISSFCCFGTGALIPLIPFFFPLGVSTAAIISAVLVGLALMFTGSVVGLLSGATPLKRALRQLIIGLGAAAITYGLGSLFGVSTG